MNGKRAKQVRRAALMVYAHDVMPVAKQAIASGNERALVKLPTPKQITRRIKRELRIAVKAAGHG